MSLYFMTSKDMAEDHSYTEDYADINHNLMICITRKNANLSVYGSEPPPPLLSSLQTCIRPKKVVCYLKPYPNKFLHSTKVYSSLPTPDHHKNMHKTHIF